VSTWLAWTTSAFMAGSMVLELNRDSPRDRSHGALKTNCRFSE
jgi:hypothetical protein